MHRGELASRRITLVLAGAVTLSAGVLAAAPPAVAAAPPSSGSVWAANQWTSANGNTLADVAKIIGSSGTTLTGAGVGVALVDTGVVSVPGLPASQIVNGPDLSFESQAANLRYLDTYGHGTHLAGIIVGNDPATGTRGIAPGAKLTSIKVGDASGAADVTQVIAAVNWVVAHRNDDSKNPIRVINLAYGTDGNADWTTDPLTFALENAIDKGIVVVVAGGNAGVSSGRLANPGLDPRVLSVGSAANNSTITESDDQISSFSSLASVPDLDLVAPGESIVSLRNPGSYVDLNYPAARVGDSLFRGGGSSQASAVVSGAVALLLQKYPNATSPGIQRLLRDTATPLTHGSYTTKVKGELNLAAALKQAPINLVDGGSASNGLGTLETSRGTNHVVHNNVTLQGQADIMGTFNASAWTTAVKGNTAWKGGLWMGRRLAGDGWTGTSWASKTWAGATWTTNDWGGASWVDASWSGRYWSGRYWSGQQWDGRYWSSSYWASSGWTGAHWN